MLVQPDGTLAPNDGAFQTSYKGEIANRPSARFRM